jgi:hypothetical protein
MKLATLAEFAARYRVSERTVRRWIKAGLVDSVLIGGRRLVKVRALEIPRSDR